ncbi:hypothetical protein A9K69_20555 [Stenotrophomonas maltophilia]|nr:hypothetical protein A9K69_20555 [Stenotrophomonas maltophilia]
MPQKYIDQTTIQPDGRPGDDAFTAFATCNDNFADAEGRLSALEGGSSNIGQDVADLKTGLQQETQLRTDADTALSQAIAAEVAARQSADTALGARIPGKNRLINGNFDFFQRGNFGNVTSAAPYTADRWICSAAGGATCNWGIGAPAVGEIPWARRFLGFNIVSGTTSAWVGQRIENVSTFAGGKATASFWMRSGVAGKKVGVLIQQVFGSGGSALVQVDGPVITLGTAFQKYTVTFDVPSVAGKTYGANNNLLLCFFYTDNRPELFGGQLINQTGLFELAQVQFESGDMATEFDFRPLGYELSLCQRYYEKSLDVETAPAGNLPSGYTVGTAIAAGTCRSTAQTFKAAKRSNPAITLYTNSAVAAGTGFWGLFNGSSWSRGAASALEVNTAQFHVNLNFGSGLTTFYSYLLGGHWTADAEI